MTDGRIEVYGDGSVVRDFIYIDDATRGIQTIAEGDNEIRIFNLGSGKGTSVNEVIEIIKETVQPNLKVNYIASRASDVPKNYLDINRYESIYGKLNPISLKEGIRNTASFIQKHLIGNK